MLRNSQLIELIGMLTPEEKAQLPEFARLRLFNNNRLHAYVLPLIELCMQYSWHDPTQDPDKGILFERLFPGEPFIPSRLDKLMSCACKFLRNLMLAHRYLQDDNAFYQSYDFSEIVRLRGNGNRYELLLDQLEKTLTETVRPDHLHYHRQFLYEYAVHGAESFHNRKTGDVNVPQTLEALDIHHLLNELILFNAYLLQQKVAKVEMPPGLKERMERLTIPAGFAERSALIKLNGIVFAVMKKDVPEPEDARHLFDTLQRLEPQLDADALAGLYTYLRNICTLILFNNPNEPSIDQTLFELYKDNLGRGYLHYEGKLHPSKYLAISGYAIKLKQYDWVMAFIERYKDELIDENETRDAYRLNLACYLFSQGQFDACLDNIPDTSAFMDYLMTGKRLELKCLYELNHDLLLPRIEAFKMHVYRTSFKTLSGVVFRKNRDFVNVLGQLVACAPGDHRRAQRIARRLAEERGMAEWEWLREKVERSIRGVVVAR